MDKQSTTAVTKIWSPKDDEFLRRNAGLLPILELADALKRSKTAVALRAHNLKISLRCTNTNWSAEQRAKLIELKDGGSTWGEIALFFERTSEACRKAYQRAVLRRDYVACFKETVTSADLAEYAYQLFTIVKDSELAEVHKDLLAQIELRLTQNQECEPPQLTQEV